MDRLRITTYRTMVLALMYASFTASPLHAGPRVSRLRCEYQKSPLGIDATNPRFAWMIGDQKRVCYKPLIKSWLLRTLMICMPMLATCGIVARSSRTNPAKLSMLAKPWLRAPGITGKCVSGTSQDSCPNTANRHGGKWVYYNQRTGLETG